MSGVRVHRIVAVRPPFCLLFLPPPSFCSFCFVRFFLLPPHPAFTCAGGMHSVGRVPLSSRKHACFPPCPCLDGPQLLKKNPTCALVRRLAAREETYRLPSLEALPQPADSPPRSPSRGTLFWVPERGMKEVKAGKCSRVSWAWVSTVDNCSSNRSWRHSWV